MKNITSLSLAATLMGLVPSVYAGDVVDTPVAPPSTKNGGDFLKVSGNIRTRYEFRETDPADPSHALTVRARLGLTLGDFNGFSAYVEGEGTQGLAEDYTGGGGARPVHPGGSVIADPNNAELNQAYLQYKKDGALVKVGRQRIIRNKAAFIGNVGWRQNEQTFDAAQVGYSTDGFDVSFAYFDRVQRIFGDDAVGAAHEFEGDYFIFDISKKTDIGKVGGYAYLLDTENQGNVGESNTFGAFIQADNGVYAEFAYQDGTSNLVGGDNDYSALYGHLKYTTDAAGGKGTFGVEYLGDHFKTPLATVHAYNGFADAFIGQRIGLNNGPGGNYNGITDIYASYVKKGLPGGLVFKGFLHYFMDGQLDNTYGYEADAVLVKKFNDNLTGLLKAAYFEGDDFYNDIKQISFQVDYKF